MISPYSRCGLTCIEKVRFKTFLLTCFERNFIKDRPFLVLSIDSRLCFLTLDFKSRMIPCSGVTQYRPGWPGPPQLYCKARAHQQQKKRSKRGTNTDPALVTPETYGPRHA